MTKIDEDIGLSEDGIEAGFFSREDNGKSQNQSSGHYLSYAHELTARIIFD